MFCLHQFDVFHLPDLESIHILSAASAQPTGAKLWAQAGSVFMVLRGVIEQVPHRAFRLVSKHQIYSKNWSGNYTKLRVDNSKAGKQFLSSAFFNIPPFQSSTSGEAASALFHPVPGQISTFLLSPEIGHQTIPFFKKNCLLLPDGFPRGLPCLDNARLVTYSSDRRQCYSN